MDSLKNRSTGINPHNRFLDTRTSIVEEHKNPNFSTRRHAIRARSIITKNQSPDVPFETSINPYNGCEHGCVYCFARPSHEYLGHSLGLDFETELYYKSNAVEVLKQTLGKKNYVCKPITLGANTDCYQPLEKDLQITRGILQTLLIHRHPAVILTKSSLVLRDMDLLSALAEKQLIKVLVSVTTLDDGLKRIMEPRTAAPKKRLNTIETLKQNGVPVGVLVAPIIPAINDREIESIVQAITEAGAESAGYVLLRLPHQLKALFRDWLQRHFPERADHVETLIRSCRGGKLYDSGFKQRMRGSGPYAQLLRQRFELACRKFGIDMGRRGATLNCDSFKVPQDGAQPNQLTLL